MFQSIKKFLAQKRKVAAGSGDDDWITNFMAREKILVFVISFLLAFCLWFIVNLSRDFPITVRFPLQVENLPEDRALVGELPAYISVGVSGEGWQLIPVYKNPPSITVEVSGEGEINLLERVQQQMSIVSDVNIIQVDPVSLNLQFEEKATRKVPVESRVEVRFREQYGMIREPVLSPDSVSISGARSVLDTINSLETWSVELNDVRSKQSLDLRLEIPDPGISADPPSVSYQIEVAEFTEGELMVPVRVRNLPPGRAVTFNPSSVRLRYDVPIEYYNDVQNSRPFIAYVEYETIEADTTGLIAPEIEQVSDEHFVRLRNYQPRTIFYFNVLNDE